MKKLRSFLDLARPEKARKPHQKEITNIKELFVRDNRIQRKSESVKKKYGASICRYGNNCKESRAYIPGKIHTVVV